ncbi:gamma-glutamyl-gamma-aminobutyrate hydrolase family protein [Geomicrobium sp. JSM 1781026]|uniref:gamma-glutamyl-gamma-aminobutyrate hydrolase family protein n=1 Tax=Geomicrobium sp. JSM 1781026 TaxID=3344580 RepID=UPI0035C26C13
MEKPIIGITSSIKEDGTHMISKDNIRSIVDHGGVPFILPNVTLDGAAALMSDKLDGLLVTGGGDIDPTLFGEEPHPSLGTIHPDRDTFEMRIIEEFLKRDLPILSICRGCQVVNIAAGGDMYQDIYAQKDEELLQHQQKAPRFHTSHYIDVVQNTKLAELSGSTRYRVNSYHHQAVREIAPGFRVSATSSDGVIEAFESDAHRFVLNVQWHPENLSEDVYANRLFAAFIEATKQ